LWEAAQQEGRESFPGELHKGKKDDGGCGGGREGRKRREGEGRRGRRSRRRGR